MFALNFKIIWNQIQKRYFLPLFEIKQKVFKKMKVRRTKPVFNLKILIIFDKQWEEIRTLIIQKQNLEQVLNCIHSSFSSLQSWVAAVCWSDHLKYYWNDTLDNVQIICSTMLRFSQNKKLKLTEYENIEFNHYSILGINPYWYSSEWI